VTASHLVQSHRTVIEQTIADIKLWKVMFGNKVRDSERFEKVLDCVLALHNMKVLMKHDVNFTIPKRRNVIHGEHVFKQKQELNLGIPPRMTPNVIQE